MFIPKGHNPVIGRRIVVLKELTVPDGIYTKHHVFKVLQVNGDGSFYLGDTESYKEELIRTIVTPLTRDEYLIIPDSI